MKRKFLSQNDRRFFVVAIGVLAIAVILAVIGGVIDETWIRSVNRAIIMLGC